MIWIRSQFPKARRSHMFRPNRTSTIAGIAVVAVIAGLSYLLTGPAVPPASAQDKPPAAPQSTAVFDADGKMKLPTGYRAWVFVGAPLTPQALNDNKARFPEYHHVYVERKNVDAYLKTGDFPEGTVIVKELTL